MNALVPARRVSHVLTRRLLSVLQVDAISPRMRRIALGGAALDGFTSRGPDDHVKLFFPMPNGETVARDYTPRRHDASAGTLVVEFVLHGTGPASGWAASARPGDTLLVGGPRSSRLAPDDGLFTLLVGDETALPAIARRLEEMPPGLPAHAIVEIADADAVGRWRSSSAARITWVHRGDTPAGTTRHLEPALREAMLPDGPMHAWLAGEIEVVRTLRRHLIAERGLPREAVQAAGYWRRGVAGAHDRIGPDAD